MSLFGNIDLPDKPSPENVRRLDLLPVPMARSMMRYGFRISKEHFADLSSSLRSRMKGLHKDITSEIPPSALDRLLDDESEDDDADTPPPEFNVQSSKKIRDLLYDVLGLQHTKGVKVKKTKGGELSTGKKTLEQLKREHPIVSLILEYRECSKLDGTYAQAMPRRARLHPRGADCPLCGRHHYTDEWRVHTKLMLTRTATGRTASKDPNLANIPGRNAAGREIRAGFIASEGHVISQRDFAQIELRLMADRSGDQTMIEVYAKDGDIHLETACRTFGLQPHEVDKLAHRAPSKNTNFAVAYLISGAGLLDLMASTFATAGKSLPNYMTQQWCEDFIEKWFQVYPGVKKYLAKEEEKARRHAIVWTATGRVRRIPEVRSYHSYVQAAGVRQGCNHGIQGFSADIMKLAMGELTERFSVLQEYGIEAYPLQTIYDELLVETPEEHGETVQVVMAEVMDHCLDDKQTGVRQCRVPIQSDGHCMRAWKKD